jgi:hypothetical protein
MKQGILVRNEQKLWDIITTFELPIKEYKYDDTVYHKLFGDLKVVRHEANTVICVSRNRID